MQLPRNYLFTDYIVAPPVTAHLPAFSAPYLPKIGSDPPPPLLPEIYALIIPHLLRTLPKAGAQNPHHTLHQADLATALRVNKLFYSIAAPILYNVIITSHLPSLIHGIDQPAAASGLKSKAELLIGTQRLHLEYAYYREPTYLSLMLHDGDYFYLLHPSNCDIVRFCAAECEKITSSLSKLSTLPHRQLAKFSTCAFTTAERWVWGILQYPEALQAGGMGVTEGMAAARTALRGFLASSTCLESFCQWAGWGPLAFGNAMIYTKGGHPSRTLQYSCHLNPDTGAIPILVNGSSARWYIPFETAPRDPGLVEGMRTLVGSIGNQVAYREEGWKELDKKQAAQLSPSVNVEFYLPASMTEPRTKKHVQEQVAMSSKEMYDAYHVPRSRYRGDVWRVGKIEEALPCGSCGGVTLEGGSLV